VGAPRPAGITIPPALPVSGVWMRKEIPPQELSKNSCEAMEYSLAVGLVIVAGCAVMGSVGIKVLAGWHSVSDSMDGPKTGIVVEK
jgi:hypothetical protein